MSVIRFGGFLGEIPRIHPRLLPTRNAQVAKNTRFSSGALEAVRGTSNLQSTVLTNPISLYRYSDSVWLESVQDTDWVTYPVPNDQFGRVIYGHPLVPDGLRVTDASLVGAGGAPASYWKLDVPPPTQGFSAELVGTADDDTEVPETRFYVCTFVNNYGAEGPPSPPSNQVEWRTGQTVTLSNLPAVPVGSYNITHRRIYRVNTGSTGVTNYQFVTEIAVASATVSVSAISQANPVVVDTTTNHGLTNGQQVKFTGLGLEATQAVEAILKQNPVQVTITGHGLQSGWEVEMGDLGGGNGMDELDGVRGIISVVDVDRFTITGIDATGYVTYSSGGTAARSHGMDELDDQQYFMTVIDDDSFALDGVDGSAYQAYVDSGTVGQVAGTSYVDNVPSASLAEVLPTELYDPPNVATRGIRVHPSGFLIGFFGNTIAFSEIGAPHAWPIDYRLATNDDIVGVGVFGNSILVTTEGYPYLLVGSDPAAISAIELELEQACVSKRGIVDFGAAVAYPSPDGLMLASNQGAENVTAPLFTRDEWQLLDPSSFLAFNWEQQYLCFYDDGVTQRGMLLNPVDPTDGVVYFDVYATGGYKDIEEDLLYLIVDDEIEIWDQGTRLEYTWKSKPVQTPRAVNMAASKVIADAYPVELDFYVDEVLRHSRVVSSIEAFRLPGGFKGEKFEIRAKGKKRVAEIIMATTMMELSVTV